MWNHTILIPNLKSVAMVIIKYHADYELQEYQWNIQYGLYHTVGQRSKLYSNNFNLS
jgi:hypothetical protein